MGVVLPNRGASGVARPGPSRARPDLIIDYHIMDITVLAVESA